MIPGAAVWFGLALGFYLGSKWEFWWLDRHGWIKPYRRKDGTIGGRP